MTTEQISIVFGHHISDMVPSVSTRIVIVLSVPRAVTVVTTAPCGGDVVAAGFSTIISVITWPLLVVVVGTSKKLTLAM